MRLFALAFLMIACVALFIVAGRVKNEDDSRALTICASVFACGCIVLMGVTE